MSVGLHSCVCASLRPFALIKIDITINLYTIALQACSRVCVCVCVCVCVLAGNWKTKYSSSFKSFTESECICVSVCAHGVLVLSRFPFCSHSMSSLCEDVCVCVRVCVCVWVCVCVYVHIFRVTEDLMASLDQEEVMGKRVRG